jgi:hypothetical protein
MKNINIIKCLLYSFNKLLKKDKQSLVVKSLFKINKEHLKLNKFFNMKINNKVTIKMSYS